MHECSCLCREYDWRCRITRPNDGIWNDSRVMHEVSIIAMCDKPAFDQLYRIILTHMAVPHRKLWPLAAVLWVEEWASSGRGCGPDARNGVGPPTSATS